jgi:chitinase
LLSVGGGYPINYTLPSVEVAEYFADFLWGAFGPSTAAWVNANKPRPFGDASVDGFDLDIEALISPAPFPDYLFANYDKFVDRLKNVAFPTGPGTYYISAAPQCQVPDVRLADAIQKSHFDFIFAQFYNTAQCNTRAGYNGLSAASTTFTYSTWVDWLKTNSYNKAVKLYLGMPAGVKGAPNDPTATLTITEANALLKFYKAKHPDMFGGAMLWEATVSAVINTKCGKGYSAWIKSILLGTFTNEVCPTSSSTVASSTSRPASSTSTGAIPTQTATIPTPDGTCGVSGYTCIGFVMGECCSPYGYCGSSSDHCGTGCQPGSGKCGIQSSSSVVMSSTIRPSSTLVSSTIRPSSTVPLPLLRPPRPSRRTRAVAEQAASLARARRLETAVQALGGAVLPLPTVVLDVIQPLVLAPVL